VKSEENVYTETLRKWREDTRGGGMLTRWVTRTPHREIPETSHKRKSNIRSFAGKEKRQYNAMGLI
jgi:hypothetical protein